MYGHDDFDADAATSALVVPAAAAGAAGAAVTAEERQLQLDFHALLADYVVGRRRVEDHPDAEQRCVVWVCGCGCGLTWVCGCLSFSLSLCVMFGWLAG